MLTACSEVPWNPDQNTGAQASAHILYNKLDMSPDDVLVAARTRNDAGHPTPITSILTQTTGPKNGYKKYLYQHRENEHAAKGTGDYSGAKPEGDNSLLLSPGEKPTSITEKAFADMWNPDVPSITSALESDGILSRLKAREGSKRYDIEPEKVQEGLAIANDNIVVGPMDTKDSDIAYKTDGFRAVGDIINPNKINENPKTVGQTTHEVISRVSMKFYNEVAYDDDKYLKIDFTGDIENDPSKYSPEDFVIETIGREAAQDLDDALLQEKLEKFKN